MSQYWMNAEPELPLLMKTNCSQPWQAVFGDPAQAVLVMKLVLT